MPTKQEELRDRTKRFALRILKLFRALPRTEEARIIGRQLLRSGMSVAANYRAVCRARSRPEFIAKIGTVLEEADESEFWLELLVDGQIVSASRLAELRKEAGELVLIFSSAQQTSKRNGRF